MPVTGNTKWKICLSRCVLNVVKPFYMTMQANRYQYYQLALCFTCANGGAKIEVGEDDVLSERLCSKGFQAAQPFVQLGAKASTAVALNYKEDLVSLQKTKEEN